MEAYFNGLFAQSGFIMSLALIGAAVLSYTFANVLETWLTGVLLFPGLFVGGLAAVDLAMRAGMIVGRDKETAIVGACFAGLMISLMAYYMLFNLLQWMNSHNRRAHRELLDRCGDNR